MVNGVLFDFFNVDALAELANQLLDRKDEYKVLGRQGAAIIREKYSIDFCLPRMVEMYESLAENPPAGDVHGLVLAGALWAQMVSEPLLGRAWVVSDWKKITIWPLRSALNWNGTGANLRPVDTSVADEFKAPGTKLRLTGALPTAVWDASRTARVTYAELVVMGLGLKL